MNEFFLELQPPRTTSQQKGQNRQTGQYYKPPKLQAAEDLYMLKLKPHRPQKPLNGAIKLEVYFYFGTKKKADIGKPKTTRPDTDNMVKLLKDCMTKLQFWHDDAQVALEIVGKFWHKTPGIFIRYGKIDNQKQQERNIKNE